MLTTRALALASIVACMLFGAVSSAVAALPVTPDVAWGTNGKVDAVLRAGNTIYVAGTFSALQDPNSAQTTPVTNLAGIDATTGLPTSFAPAVDGEVFGLATSPDGSRLYAVGNFTTVNGRTQKRIAAFDTDTGALDSWRPYAWPNNVVRGIAVSSDHVYVGGGFRAVGTTPAAHIASFRPSDGAASPGFTASSNDLVRDFALVGGRLYLAGDFTTVNGTTQGKLAAINPVSGASIAGVYHPNYPVLDLAVGTRLYAAGGGGGGKALAVNLATGAKIWEKKTDGNVQAVDVLNDTPYFGGHFLKYDGTVVSQLVRANPATGALDTTWLPQVTAGFLGVFAIDAYGGNKLYVGGDFTRVGTIKRTNFAEFTDGAAPVSADVSVTLSASSANPAVGQNVVYTAKIGNAGPDTAVSVTVTDVLPAGLDFVSAPGCTYTGSNRTVSCDLGSVTHSRRLGCDHRRADRRRIDRQHGIGQSCHGRPRQRQQLGYRDGGCRRRRGRPRRHGCSPRQGRDGQEVLAGADRDQPWAHHLAGNGGRHASGGSHPDRRAQGHARQLLGYDHGHLQPRLDGAGGNRKDHDQADCAGRSADALQHGLGERLGGRSGRVEQLGCHHRQRHLRWGGHHPADDDGDADARLGSRWFRGYGGGQLQRAVGGVRRAMHRRVVSDRRARRRVAAVGGGDRDHCDAHAGRLDGSARYGGRALQDRPAAGQRHPGRLGEPCELRASAPADGAGPVPVGFRHQHNNGVGCSGLPNTLGLAEPCDELTSEWSEQLLPSSIPATTASTITDPPGTGNQTVTIPGFTRGPMDLGSAGYLTLDGSSATWASSTLVLSSAGDALTARIAGPCTGTGCTALAIVGNVTVTYVPAATITDLAGNPAAGSFTKTQTMY